MTTRMTRREKLEKIKPFIPLKTYHLILEKLEFEEQQAAKQDLQKERRRRKTEMEQSQALPKVFFEQEFLTPKIIRID